MQNISSYFQEISFLLPSRPILGPLQTILTSNTSAEVQFDLFFKPSIPDFSKLHEENAIKLWDALYYVIKKNNSKKRRCLLLLDPATPKSRP